jgi:hypothetical protein
VSDKNDRELSFAIAIDNWICIEDSHNTVLTARNNAIGQLDQKTQDSEQWQQEQMLLWSNKKEPGYIVCKRKASEWPDLKEDSEDDSQSSEAGESWQSQSTQTPSSAPTPTPGPERSRSCC